MLMDIPELTMFCYALDDLWGHQISKFCYALDDFVGPPDIEVPLCLEAATRYRSLVLNFLDIPELAALHRP